MLAAEVAAEQRHALQQRLRHDSPPATKTCGERRRLNLVATRPTGAEVAAEVAGWIQGFALNMLAAEVAAEQRRALQQRLRHQIKEASGQLQEGAAEAGEAQTAV